MLHLCTLRTVLTCTYAHPVIIATPDAALMLQSEVQKVSQHNANLRSSSRVSTLLCMDSCTGLPILITQNSRHLFYTVTAFHASLLQTAGWGSLGACRGTLRGSLGGCWGSLSPCWGSLGFFRASLHNDICALRHVTLSLSVRPDNNSCMNTPVLLLLHCCCCTVAVALWLLRCCTVALLHCWGRMLLLHCCCCTIAVACCCQTVGGSMLKAPEVL